MKHLLLFTCDTLADTGKVSFSYIFNSDKGGSRTSIYDEYPRHCSGPFGLIRLTDHATQKYYINVFEGGKGFIFSGAIDTEDKERNQRFVDDCFPEYFTSLCTKEVADHVKELLSGLVEVEILYFDNPILTS